MNTSTKFLKLKKRHLVYYSLSDINNYNQKSKKNLVQFATPLEDIKKLKELQKIQSVECINSYSKQYLKTYEEVMKKPFKTNFSQTQKKKISDSTNTFIDCIKHNYKKNRGWFQRKITFVTLTIPEDQKHTDKVLVKTLIDFIDHLKKVKNTLVQNKIDTGVKLLRLENYVWRAETTEKGNIHFHLLFDTYVNHETLKRVWNNYLKKLGYENGERGANIHNLSNINDVGDYVTKYLTKEPLNDEFTELLKSKKISREDLNNYEPEFKYRRPILYTSWGCSKNLKNLKAPTFSGSEIYSFEELKNKCEKVELSEDLKDFVKIYKGKIYDLLNKCSYNLKKVVKNKFKSIYDYLYNKTQLEKEYLQQIIDVHRVNFNTVEIVSNVISNKASKPYQSNFDF